MKRKAEEKRCHGYLRFLLAFAAAGLVTLTTWASGACARQDHCDLEDLRAGEPDKVANAGTIADKREGFGLCHRGERPYGRRPADRSGLAKGPPFPAPEDDGKDEAVGLDGRNRPYEMY